MLPAAPGLLSTITDCPMASVRYLPTARADMSTPPPGWNPTMMRTGLDGYDCAMALADSSVHAAAAAMATARNVFTIFPPRLLFAAKVRRFSAQIVALASSVFLAQCHARHLFRRCD